MNENLLPAKNAEKRGAIRGLSSLSRRKIFRARLVSWFGKNGRDLPWRRTRDPYAVLVSEIMLQQTQVATVIPFYDRWMKLFPNVTMLAQADEADVLHAWQGLGYYSRARNLHRAAQVLAKEHGAKFPHHLDDIRALPGVGRYTAGAVATFAFDQATPIVDANIARVLARLLDLQTPIDSSAGSAALWNTATELQPMKNARLFNSALMELGALVCTPRTPNCHACPVANFCLTTNPENLPRKRARQKTVALTEDCAFTFSRGKILLEQQTQSRWNGLWKLPAVKTAVRSNPLLRLTYPFTHHRVHLSVFRQQVANGLGKWHAVEALPPMPSPHRRAVERLLKSFAGDSASA